MRSRDGNAPVLALALFMGASLLATDGAWALAQCGKASWYAPGGITASGEPNRAGALTAAHPNLPFGTRVSVRNLGNGKSVVLSINDRGRFAGDRIIDVSRAAAEALGFVSHGVARVQVTVLGDVGVKLRGACKSTDAAATDAAATADQQDETTVPVERPVADSAPVARPVSKTSMSARFSLAFRPESWTEAELKKALEAFLPVLRP